MADLSKRDLQDLRIHRARRKKFLFWTGGAAAVLVILGLTVWRLATLPTSADRDVLTMCVQHAAVSMHIHPTLSIYINGRKEEIPHNVGVAPGCMRPIHAHDDSGTIHLEFPVYREVKLGEFFRVWGRPFNLTEKVKMIVNGQDNYELENYIMRDHDQIELYYE